MMLGRFSGQWLERVLGDTLLLASAASVAGVGLLVASLAQTVPVAIVAFFLGGAGVSVAAPGCSAPPAAARAAATAGSGRRP